MLVTFYCCHFAYLNFRWCRGFCRSAELDRSPFSQNSGPPPGNKFDLEIWQRSRSYNGINRKGLSQWSCIPNINALLLILQTIWARFKFLWQTEGQTDGQTDRRMRFNVPRFRERRGTTTNHSKIDPSNHSRFIHQSFRRHWPLQVEERVSHKVSLTVR